MNPDYHIPVMAEETVSLLAPQRGGIYVDCTMGGGGHTERILEALGTKGFVTGIDQDGDAILRALERFGPADRVNIIKGNFGDLDTLLAENKIEGADGFLFDLGVSSHQLDAAERGFSFRNNAKLDMRMDTTSGITAFELVNTLPTKELEKIFREYGEEKWAGRIATWIERRRVQAPLETTDDLAACIERAIPGGGKKYKIHPATRVFMALRIAVNRELQNLEKGIRSAIRVSNHRARIVVISYHSLEDRIVKNLFRDKPLAKDPVYGIDIFEEGSARLVNLVKKPLLPSEEEIKTNPRARSAKIRAVEVIKSGGKD